MELRILGPIEAIGADGQPISLGGPRARRARTLEALADDGARLTLEDAVALANESLKRIVS
jgi:hypothetical protein